MNEQQIKTISALVAQNFRTFGGGKAVSGNPISALLADTAPQFAAGVDVEQVVRFVLATAASESLRN